VSGARRSAGPGLRFHLGLYGAYATTLLLWLAARYAVLGRLGRPAGHGHLLNPLNAEPWWPARPLTSLRTLVTALRETVLPLQECFNYGFNQIPVAYGLLSVDVLAGLAACVFLSVLLWRRRRATGGGTSDAILLGALVFLIAWLPVSSLTVPAVAVLAERYLYLPSFGWCLALGALWGELWIRAPRRRPWLLVGALVLLLAASVSTIRRNTAFGGHLTLAGRAAANCQESAHAQYLYAGALVNAGRLAEALPVYRRALEIEPRYVDAGADLAQALARLGLMEEAARRARTSLEAGPEAIFEKLAVASALASAGLHSEASDLFAEIQREHPDDQRILFLRAERSIGSGRLPEALAIFERIRTDLPRHPVGYVGVGRVRIKRGELDAAREALEEAVRLDPYDPEALSNLAHLALISKPGTPDLAREAKSALERYLVIRPKDALGWLRLGSVSERLGDLGEAESAYRRAAALAPESAVPRRALSGLLRKQGRDEEARSLEEDRPESPGRRPGEPDESGR
jgi:Flp pilus assembly protein TadD